MCAVGWDCPTRQVNYIYSTHFSFVKHRMTSGRGSYWLLVTRYSCFTLRQGFGWQAPPPVARSATPPARIPPTQTMFARGLGAVGIGATDAINYCDSFHSWAVALDHPGTLARATPPQRGTRTATGTYQVPLHWRGGGLPPGW